MSSENRNRSFGGNAAANRQDAPVIGPGGKRPPGGPGRNRIAGEKPKNLRSAFFRLADYLRRSAGMVAALLFMMLLATAANVLRPVFQQRAIDCITVSGNGFTVDLEGMGRALAMLGVILGASAVISLFQGQISAKLSQKTVGILRRDLFDKMVRLPVGYLDSHSYGDLMSRMTNDAENISDAVSRSLVQMISSVLTLLGVTGMMFLYSPPMALITLISVPVLFAVSSFVTRFARRHYLAQQKDLGAMNGHIEEMISGCRTVAAYGRERDMTERFSEISASYRDHSVYARVWGSLMPPLTGFIGNLQYVILAVVGAWLMIRGGFGITIGVIHAMLQYSRRFNHPVSMLANQFASLLNAMAGAERIFEILDEADEVDEGAPGRLTRDTIRGDIVFENIDFGYKKEEPVLHNLSLRVDAGQCVAMAGATGSGKTTIVNLLTRFYEPDRGRITIDGVDIRDISKKDLRETMAIVLQDTVLFNGTIRENIRYGRPDADEDSVRAAAETAMADRFIEQLPDGYDTILAEGGSNLSQGQRQLLTIARAVLADPKILILDEATSSVDTRTEVMVQTAMENLMRGRTTIMIAHRLSTIRNADRIDVIGDGRVIESGTHDELLAAGGEYSRLYRKQFAGFNT